ncbi:inositol monophosphatase [Actinophytocola xinjiangensis]|uniref:inositol-phosphate phosphatase n=1 Tax=Actinophytocola xinjiangensis TaxID=485602 RepID=A0A7Z0WMW5_9PSEU|nr:inositol monophosphatase family protein [Actinophytocola xinjiangensis]OLF10497.1 inositol monophosphatase [Actinophytocola xinjiangensis]
MTELDDLARRLADVGVAAATAVAEPLREAFRTGVTVDYKRDHHDPVTVHDRRAEEQIREHLTTAVPDSVVVGEETGASGAGRVRWYVDPIDGTANFAAGLAFFCTSIGAVVDDVIVAGAIVDPVGGTVFRADTTSSTCNGQPLRAAGVTDEERALLITGYPNARDIARDGEQGLARYAELVTSFATVRRPGSSALSIAHVAAGWADAALGTSVSAWDICAAQLILTGAGGVYVPFGGDGGWDQPAYLAHSRDLKPMALSRFVERHQGGTA